MREKELKDKGTTDNIGKVEPVNIRTEMEGAYLDYAMSVIISRALPDVRDGLKPVHRRILYAVWAMGLRAGAKFRKSATVVGEVLGKFHPHGDTAVYDSMARMAQDFSLRYPLINGQGNWGCFTKDTKVRLTDGRSLSFEELIKEAKKGKRNFTYTFNHEIEKIEIAEILTPRLTKEKAELVEITLDNGEKIRCTPNHRFMLRDGGYREARYLRQNDSLMPCYFRFSTKADDENIVGYHMLLQPKTDQWDWAHYLADEWNIGHDIYAKKSGRIRHHVDFNKLNNDPNNIKRLNWKEHWKIHCKFLSEKHKNDSEYVKKLAEGRKRYIENHKDVLARRAANSLRGKWKNPEYKVQIIRKKILGYVSGLLNKYGNITSDIYENDRRNNGIPKLQNALGYFENFGEIVERAKLYNHKIVSVEKLQKREDVYDLTVDGTHNFLLDAGIFVHNSIDGDSPAAMRYTESKMAGIAEELLFDIERETVDFTPNYDGSQKEPKVLPAKLPNLLLNGSMGIAVGMATNIPPHNLTEVCDAAAHLIDNPDCAIDDLMAFVKGPDFPTGGVIFDKNEIKAAYATGRGGIVIQARADIEEDGNKFRIIVTEIPYQVNKSTLIEKIAELVQEKKLEGIRDIRDESSKEGIRIVIELKKDAYPKKVLNRLFVLTQLQTTFHVNTLALVDGLQPKILTLKNILEEYIRHRLEVVRRRAEYDLARARERAHILDGLKIAILHIDKVINTIKKSADKDAAKVNLMKQFRLTEVQAIAILEMRLQQLANLERLKVEQELKDKKALIKELEELLASKKKMQAAIKREIQEIKEKYGDERRTKVIAHGVKEFKPEDLVPNEPTIVVITKDGYIKRLPPDTFKTQHRGGKGVIGLTTKEEDFVEQLFTTMTHNDLMFFTTRGRIFQLKTYDVPPATRTAKGQALVNFLQLGPNEKVSAVLSVDDLSEDKYLVMVTRSGLIKKVDKEAFANVRRSGLIAIGLKNDDHLEWVRPSTGNDDIMIVTARGQSIRFKEKDVRAMGRTASGVRAARLKKGDRVIGMDIVNPKLVAKNSLELFVIAEKGYGKRTNLKSYKVQRRGGSGVKTASVTSKTGGLIGAYVSNVDDERDLIVISTQGQVIRTPFKSVPSLGRATQGVRLMRFKDEGDGVASVTFI